MASTREQIIQTTCTLLETQGYYATGLNQIVEESGAPKGSLYYYFPDGKEGLTAEAIERTGRAVAGRIHASLAEIDAPGEAVAAFFRTIGGYVRASDFKAGGPITTVALETAGRSERLSQACAEAYRLWQGEFRAKLVAGGMDEARAARLASLIIAALEGAIVLSRTFHSVEPFENAGLELRCLIETACA